MEEKINLYGKVTVIIDDEKVFESDNMILAEGYDYVAKLIGGYTGEGSSFGIESIAVGNDGASPSLTNDDLIGSQINEGEIIDEESGLVSGTEDNEAKMRLVADITNNSSNPRTHEEAVLTNNYDASQSERECLSRISFGEGVVVEPDFTVRYIWDIIVGA